MATESLKRYVILPTHGLVSSGATSSAVKMTLRSFSGTAPRPQQAPRKMRVLDSIAEDGAKLVEMTPREMRELRTMEPGLRIVPEVFYKPQWSRPEILKKAKAAAGATATQKKMSVKVKDSLGAAVKGALVVAFTNFEAKEGDQGRTNASGEVKLKFPGSFTKVQRLYVFPDFGCWGRLKKNVTIVPSLDLTCESIDITFTDCVFHFFGKGGVDDGKGVKVGVIDTGVGPHADLAVSGGKNTVTGEVPTLTVDNGAGHGTHVAGTIASSTRGVAPGAEIFAYRVFGSGAEGASNFAISKAIDQAILDGCDIINMSLGGEDPDPATGSAIAAARAKGVAVLAAAGNEYRSPVGFPAADPRAVAVGAMGRLGTFPTGADADGDVSNDRGSEHNNFVAAFSNKGPEIEVIGPGVGVISTYPGNRYAVMSGTSMATPAVAGLLARKLSKSATLLGAARDAARSDKIIKLLLDDATSMGFPVDLEGVGLPNK